MKKYYENIFIVLVYKNIEDIQNFILQAQKKVKSKKIVIVESYSDELCTEKLRNIAIQNECDFLPIENKGYSYGNNKGIQYACEKYDFDFLIVCNADVDIIKFPDRMPKEYGGKVIAPIINTIKGKAQNPFWAKKNSIAEWLMYKGYKCNILFISYMGFALYKLQREFFLRKFYHLDTSEEKIMAAHGAFVIFSKEVLDKIGLPYDEKMFLFAEECFLAHKLETYHIDTMMTKKIEICHHEDGSMDVSNIKQMEERKKSIVYYYEKIK